MCMEDIKIGRRTGVYSKSTPGNGTVEKLLDHDPKRIAIILSHTKATAMRFGQTVEDTATHGFLISPTNMPLTLTVQEFGTLVTGPLYADEQGIGIRASATCIHLLQED